MRDCARCRSDVGGRSAGRGREPLLLRRAAAAEPRLGGTTAIANGQLTRPLALRPNKRVEPTGWIEAILAPRSSKKAFPMYQCRTFQPAAHAQTVQPSDER